MRISNMPVKMDPGSSTRPMEKRHGAAPVLSTVREPANDRTDCVVHRPVVLITLAWERRCRVGAMPVTIRSLFPLSAAQDLNPDHRHPKQV